VGSLRQDNFSRGWFPSADAVNAPANSLLRMDNLVLDSIGAVSLRPGSVKINSTAFSDTDVHSLFTTTISGTRTRMSGATSAVYANGTSIASSFAGTATDDIQFGAHMGQILMARSTTKKKYDGTTVRTWGIAAPGAAPTLSGLAADSKTFATCESTESPIMTSNEGSQAFVTGITGEAIALTPDSITARATSTKTFAAPTSFATYDAGQTGVDEDLVEMDVFITEPQYLDRITLMIDVNGGLFQSDYYVYEFINGQATEIQLPGEEILASDYTAEGYERADVLSRTEDRGNPKSVFRVDEPVSNSGWNHFSVPRGTMTRVGATSGKNWSTVEAVRVTFVGLSGGTGAIVRFDNIKITGGSQRALTGKYKGIVVAVRNDGTYEALSAPSTASSEYEVKGQGIRATVDSSTVSALDTQVNELWLFLMGGRLDGYYRAATLTGGPFSGAQTIDAATSDRAILIANIRLETDNTTPPDTIIGIDGPHYDRTMCLTSTYLYPSRQRNPDSYASGEVIRVGDATETALWVKKSRENLYVGTTRDIYRLDGDFTVLPDGTINVAKRPMGVTRPPISSAVAIGNVNGSDVLVYLASDGPRVLNGALLADDSVSLLWRGQTRHGVSGVNTSSTGRFRMAITDNVLYVLTPEGASTTSSTAIHAYHFGFQRWYRFTYPQAFRSVAVEPDGTLIAGDSSGYVRELDETTNTDDGSDISVVVRTPEYANSLNPKTAQNIVASGDAGTADITAAIHIDGSDTAALSTSLPVSDEEAATVNISTVGDFQRIQVRLSGSYSTLLFRSLMLKWLDRPQKLKFHDTGFVPLTDTMAWVRKVRINARASGNITVTPYWDGTVGTARTVTAYPNKEYVYVLPLGREDKGSTVRVTLETSDASEIYWVEFEYNESGKTRQKRISMIPEAS
jgi:hypothetical protein